MATSREQTFNFLTFLYFYSQIWLNHLMDGHCSCITNWKKRKNSAPHTLEILSVLSIVAPTIYLSPHMFSINYSVCLAKYLLMMFSSIPLAVFKTRTLHPIFLPEILLFCTYGIIVSSPLPIHWVTTVASEILKYLNWTYLWL